MWQASHGMPLYKNTYLAIVLMIPSSSSEEGALRPPGGKTKLIGSKSRDKDFER
jgi:hypothetical protein